MIQTTKIGELTKLSVSDGYIHKTGTDIYAKSIVMLPGDTIGLYEQVQVKPKYTEEERKAKVRELIRERYDSDKEHEIMREAFGAILNPEAATSSDTGDVKGIPATIAEYNAYNAYVEQCKIRAKDESLYNNENV